MTSAPLQVRWEFPRSSGAGISTRVCVRSARMAFEHPRRRCQITRSLLANGQRHKARLTQQCAGRGIFAVSETTFASSQRRWWCCCECCRQVVRTPPGLGRYRRRTVLQHHRFHPADVPVCASTPRRPGAPDAITSATATADYRRFYAGAVAAAAVMPNEQSQGDDVGSQHRRIAVGIIAKPAAHHTGARNHPSALGMQGRLGLAVTAYGHCFGHCRTHGVDG